VKRKRAGSWGRSWLTPTTTIANPWGTGGGSGSRPSAPQNGPAELGSLIPEMVAGNAIETCGYQHCSNRIVDDERWCAPKQRRANWTWGREYDLCNASRSVSGATTGNGIQTNNGTDTSAVPGVSQSLVTPIFNSFSINGGGMGTHHAADRAPSRPFTAISTWSPGSTSPRM